MTQIKVKLQPSEFDPQQLEMKFYPGTKHWGCVDWDELFNQIEVGFAQANLSGVNQQLATETVQSIIDQWEATNSLWVKSLH